MHKAYRWRSTAHIDQLDELDARILDALCDEPRVGLLEVARRVGVARGTVQARLGKLSRGVVTGFGPEVDPAQIGYPVLAFVFLEIVQGRLEEAVDALDGGPRGARGVRGDGPRDLLCRVVARDNGHLQEIINAMVTHRSIRRSTSYIAMSRQIAYRVGPLLAQAAGE